MRKTILSLALLALAVFAGPATAQSVVVLTGDTGVTTAVEVAVSSGFVVRGGAMHLTDHSDGDAYELGYVLGAGYRFRANDSRVNIDLAYDAEKMNPDLDMESEVDSRVRIGFGYRVTKRAAAVAEFSRSLVNGTDYDRVMVGLRFGW